MKKVLFATAAAVMATTAAMADVSYNTGKVHALMTVANSFEARGINIVENSNKIAVHKTVNAWNQGWNALEGNNEADLRGKVELTTLYTTGPHGTLTVESSNIVVAANGLSAQVTTREGVTHTIHCRRFYIFHTERIYA